jgi:hypothetical protein
MDEELEFNNRSKYYERYDDLNPNYNNRYQKRFQPYGYYDKYNPQERLYHHRARHNHYTKSYPNGRAYEAFGMDMTKAMTMGLRLGSYAKQFNRKSDTMDFDISYKIPQPHPMGYKYKKLYDLGISMTGEDPVEMEYVEEHLEVPRYPNHRERNGVIQNILPPNISEYTITHNGYRPMKITEEEINGVNGPYRLDLPHKKGDVVAPMRMGKEIWAVGKSGEWEKREEHAPSHTLKDPPYVYVGSDPNPHKINVTVEGGVEKENYIDDKTMDFEEYGRRKFYTELLKRAKTPEEQTNLLNQANSVNKEDVKIVVEKVNKKLDETRLGQMPTGPGGYFNVLTTGLTAAGMAWIGGSAQNYMNTHSPQEVLTNLYTTINPEAPSLQSADIKINVATMIVAACFQDPGKFMPAAIKASADVLTLCANGISNDALILGALTAAAIIGYKVREGGFKRFIKNVSSIVHGKPPAESIKKDSKKDDISVVFQNDEVFLKNERTGKLQKIDPRDPRKSLSYMNQKNSVEEFDKLKKTVIHPRAAVSERLHDEFKRSYGNFTFDNGLKFFDSLYSSASSQLLDIDRGSKKEITDINDNTYAKKVYVFKGQLQDAVSWYHYLHNIASKEKIDFDEHSVSERIAALKRMAEKDGINLIIK